MDGTLGYRFLELEESFRATEILQPTDPGFATGTEYRLEDEVKVRNTFHGVELAALWFWETGNWFGDVSSGVALGEVQSTVSANGTTQTIVPGHVDETTDGGFLVQPDGIRQFSDSQFSALPQVQANLGYRLNGNWRLDAGYNFLFLSSVFRPGAFLNNEFSGVSLARDGTPGETIPRPDRENVYLHGARIGMTYSY